MSHTGTMLFLLISCTLSFIISPTIRISYICVRLTFVNYTQPYLIIIYSSEDIEKSLIFVKSFPSVTEI